MIRTASCPSISTEISDKIYFAFLKGFVVYVYVWDYRKKYNEKKIFCTTFLHISKYFCETEVFFIFCCHFFNTLEFPQNVFVNSEKVESGSVLK